MSPTPRTDPSPSELLRRYGRNVYPPSLSEADQAAVRGYLEEKGLEPRIGVVACEPNLTTQNLARMAMSEFGLQKDLSAEDIVVGPHSLGMPDAISIWVPAKRDMP
jgi:hypothetical protein